MRLMIATIVFAVCAASVQAGEVKLEVDGCIRGQELRVALYSSAQGFAEDSDGNYALREQAVKADGAIEHLSFADLAPGKYAVAAYMDSNGNHKLDSNFVGKPIEPYGFSRDARNRFSAPSFEQAAFELGDGSVALVIRLK